MHEYFDEIIYEIKKYLYMSKISLQVKKKDTNKTVLSLLFKSLFHYKQLNRKITICSRMGKIHIHFRNTR